MTIERVETKGRVKVGDIIYRETHMGHTDVHYYIVTKVTPKMVFMKEMDRAFTQKYRSNTPYDTCVPAIDDMPYISEDIKYDPNKYSFIESRWIYEELKGYAVMYTYESEWLKDKEPEFMIRVGYKNYSLWDYEPHGVNCD